MRRTGEAAWPEEDDKDLGRDFFLFQTAGWDDPGPMSLKRWPCNGPEERSVMTSLVAMAGKRAEAPGVCRGWITFV